MIPAGVGITLDDSRSDQKRRQDEARKARRQRESFERVRRAETAYMAQLRKIGRAIGDIVAGIRPTTLGEVAEVRRLLAQYSQLIVPWARTVARRMLDDVERRDAKAWQEFTRGMSESLIREISATPTGVAYRELMDQQVTLITSLPTKAADRVHELATKALTEGRRIDEVMDDILRTGHVTVSRAKLIARTETTRAASTFTEVRARHVGSEGYVWRTSLDRVVRPLHRKLEGRFIRWSEPPVAGEHGERAHAGCIYNCRCWAEPIIPTRFD